MQIDVQRHIDMRKAREDTELAAYQQMNREVQKRYIQQIKSSYETHIICVKCDDEAGYHHSAQIHRDNAQANLNSLRELLSEVCFNDVVGEL